MVIKQWLGTRVDVIPGLEQEARPRHTWPFEQDWLVDRICLDTGNRCYWIDGHLLGSGECFKWAMLLQPLSWRYDLTLATMEIGRHETETEAMRREYAWA